LEDVVRIYQVVIRLPSLIECLDTIQDDRHRDLIQSTYVHPLQTHYSNLSKLQEMVEATIDLEALEDHQFIIKPDFDENLQSYRKRMDDLRINMTNEHIKVGNDLKQDTEKKLKLEQQNVYGWCLRLTRNEASCIRGKKGYTELSTQKAGVYFTTTALHKMSSEFTELSQQYHQHQSGLVKEVVNIASSYNPVLQSLGSVIGNLDVIVRYLYLMFY
jgi:DNA mismatch repair protein MSH2